jgi:peptide methionine sulfoxide reductase MsrA
VRPSATSLAHPNLLRLRVAERTKIVMRTPKRRFDAEEYHQKYIAKQSGGGGGRGFFGF